MVGLRSDRCAGCGALLLQSRELIGSWAVCIEQLDCNLLFCLFVSLGIDNPVWSPSIFSKNHDRLTDADVAQNTIYRPSKIGGCTTRLDGYTVSSRICKRIEESLGWNKVVSPLRKVQACCLEKEGFLFTLNLCDLQPGAVV